MKKLLSSALVCFSTLAGATCDIDNPFVGCFEYDTKQVKSIPKTTAEPVKQAPISRSKVTEARHDSCPGNRRIYVGNAGQFLCRHDDAELKRAAADVSAMYANGGDGARTLGLVEAGLREGASNGYSVETESGETQSMEMESQSNFEIDEEELIDISRYASDPRLYNKKTIEDSALYILRNNKRVKEIIGHPIISCVSAMRFMSVRSMPVKVALKVAKSSDLKTGGSGLDKLVSGVNGEYSKLTNLLAGQEEGDITKYPDDVEVARKTASDLAEANELGNKLSILQDILICSDWMHKVVGQVSALIGK